MSANDPAFPQLEYNWDPDREESVYSLVGGLTKREYFAGLAMQGYISVYAHPAASSAPLKEDAAIRAVEYADALIKALEAP